MSTEATRVDAALPTATEPLVEATGIVKTYRSRTSAPGSRRSRIRAVDGVDLTVFRRETVGLIGESGSGKSTLGRILVGLNQADSGQLRFAGEDITHWSNGRMRQIRPRINLIFQNPYSAVNKRMRIDEIIAEPLVAHRLGNPAQRAARVRELVDLVGLPASFARRGPTELSGGQLQRVVIARALATRPDFVVADEPTASLDVSVRAQIVNLLVSLKQELGLAMLFVSHDLRTVSAISDRIVVMYRGRFVELGSAQAIAAAPEHPYTRMLIAALPRLGRDGASTVEPMAPTAGATPVMPEESGCQFAPRCALVTDVCRTVRPSLADHGIGHPVACHAVAGGGEPPHLNTGPVASGPDPRGDDA